MKDQEGGSKFQRKFANFRQGFKNLWVYYRGWKWLVFLGMSVMLIVSSYLVFIAKTTSVSSLQDGLKSVTTIYSVDDEPAGSPSAQKGTYIDLAEVSTPMKETVIGTEDKRFYDHKGIDSRGMARAAVRYVINRDASGGGGSTITQQLVKNSFLTLDQTFTRKAKEFFLALEVEKQFSKDEILEMYLNHAYFGNGVWGVENASQKYFGHPASDLDWNESMVLTGILKGPSLFNPIDEYDSAIDRRNTIVDLLEKDQVIGTDIATEVRNSEIGLYDNYYAAELNNYPYYFDAVIEESNQRTRISEDDLLTQGYRIYTHLDTAYQDQIDLSYQNGWMFPDNEEEEPEVQAASVVLDPKTGGVMAVYGGRGEYTYRGFNRATDMKRAPGSTIKPLAVYVTALEEGLNVHSLVPDVVKGYGPDKWAPENYDLQTDPSGEVELYYALAQSKNTSAVYLMDQYGIDASVKKLRQFGIQVPNQDLSLTLALGAFSEGISPLQLADAYGAFANRGVRMESSFVRRIEDARGKVVYSNEKPKKHMVMTPNIAADMTSMMLETYTGVGTGYGAGPDNGVIAGKTGSTEISAEDMDTRDRWMVSYTPDFVLVTWTGMDEVGGSSLDNLMPSGMGALFNRQTTQLMAMSPQTPFEVPPASQMYGHSNHVKNETFNEDLAQHIENASRWLEENFGDTLKNLYDKSEHVVDGLKEKIRQTDWPF